VTLLARSGKVPRHHVPALITTVLLYTTVTSMLVSLKGWHIAGFFIAQIVIRPLISRGCDSIRTHDPIG
jgi:hypothetical protein